MTFHWKLINDRINSFPFACGYARHADSLN
jgi:hypothetical protein